jgi:hypothetical protein
MTLPKLEFINPDKAICLNKDCTDRGAYLYCYLHTYSEQDCFRRYFKRLSPEQIDLLINPDDFIMY